VRSAVPTPARQHDRAGRVAAGGVEWTVRRLRRSPRCGRGR
jgi:hypothetical protein